MKYTIKGILWDSKTEYNDFKKHMLIKLKKMLNKEYGCQWDFCSNWVSISKYIGKIKIGKQIYHKVKVVAQAKVFTNPSTYGINDGRISKLEIYLSDSYPNSQFTNKRLVLFHYDRGNDINLLSNNEYAKIMYDDIVEVFN